MQIRIILSAHRGKSGKLKLPCRPRFRALDARRAGFRGRRVLLPFAQIQVLELTRASHAQIARRPLAYPTASKEAMNRSFGRYRVLQPLGQGAMAAVFLARDPVLSRLVAIKVLHPDLAFKKPLLDRFFKEAKIAARIQNPHIVEVFDFGHEGGNPYLVMEFIDGQPLQKVMDQMKGEPLDQVVAAALVCQAAEGLAHAAEAGVVHRDLKPDNLMLTARGNLKVTDFGICHLAEHTMTMTGQTLGSPRFMSPEQVKGIKPITVQSDLFSLGAVLYYCLSGQMPFSAQSLPDLYRQITEDAPPPLESLRAGLDPFLIKLANTLLDKNPTRRGGGPGWLQYQLKMYLVQRKIVDPVSLIAQYVHEIASQGVQTTCNLDAATIRRHMGSFDLEKSPLRRWSRSQIITASLAVGGLILSGTAILSLRKEAPGMVQLDLPSTVSPKDIKAEKASEEAAKEEQIPRAKEQRVHNNALRNETPVQSPKIEIPSKANQGDESTVIEGPAYLTIYSSPPFAEVALDGQGIGKTPIESRKLTSGRYRMTLTSRFAAPIETLLTLSPGPHVHRFSFLSNPESKP